MTRDADAVGEFVSAVRASGLKCMVQTVAKGKSREELHQKPRELGIIGIRINPLPEYLQVSFLL